MRNVVSNIIIRTRQVKERTPELRWQRQMRCRVLLDDVGVLGMSLYRSILQTETGHAYTIMRGR